MRRRRTLALLIGLPLALAAGRPLCAQRRAALDLGLSAVRFPDDSVAMFGPSASWTISSSTARYFAAASAAGVATHRGSSGSVELSGGVRSPLSARWFGEGSAELGALVGPLQSATGTLLVAGRLIRPAGNHGGTWLRASGDIASREIGVVGGQGLDVGAWWRWWRAEVTSSLARQWNTAQLFAGTGRGKPVGTVPVSYTEAELTARVEGDEASVAIGAAVRRDPGATTLYSPAVSATAAFWLAANRAITVSVARQLPDFVHGADAVDYVSVGVRLSEPSPRSARAAGVRPSIQVSGADSLRTVSVRAPGARTVEVMADFTDWSPIRLAPAQDGFARTLAVGPGTHHVVVRVDGGAWTPAANTPAVDDDFGGRVGLLLVP